MIKVQVIGNIGKDAELKEINGKNYLVFSLASTKKIKGENQTTWIDCYKYDNGSSLKQWLTKGKKLYVDGDLGVSTYTRNDGSPAASLKLFVSNLEFVGGGESGEQQQSYDNSQHVQDKSSTYVGTPCVDQGGCEELPF